MLSAPVSILSAAVPYTPASPTTTLNGANVDITWTAPNNGGSPITGYYIEIKNGDGVSYS